MLNRFDDYLIVANLKLNFTLKPTLINNYFWNTNSTRITNLYN